MHKPKRHVVLTRRRFLLVTTQTSACLAKTRDTGEQGKQQHSWHAILTRIMVLIKHSKLIQAQNIWIRGSEIMDPSDQWCGSKTNQLLLLHDKHKNVLWGPAR